MTRALTFLGVLLASIASSGIEAAAQPRAADLDWVPRAELPPAQADVLPWYCRGGYVDPAADAAPASDIITAFADRTEQTLGSSIDMQGNVQIENGPIEVRAPRLIYDQETEIARFEDPLVLRDRGLVATGASASANIATGTGTISSASFLLHAFHLRGTADVVERYPDSGVRLTGARVTRCEPGSNRWAIRSSRVHLDPESAVGTARNVTIRVQDVPVFYTPWLRFSLDQRRQSGFLMPSAGYDSDSGAELVAPYYFNLAPQADATYQLHLLAKRGLLHDGQLRFLLGNTVNEINGGILADDELYDPRPVNSTGTFEPEDRWYLNVRHDSRFGNQWRTMIDYNAVSDPDYLRDLDARFGTSESIDLTSALGTSVVDQRVPAIDRVGRASWRGDRFQHSLVVQGFQILDPDGIEQYEKLPEWTTSYTDKFGDVDVGFDFEYANFHKDDDNVTGTAAIVGTRVVADGQVSIRRSTPWGYIEPAAGFTWRSYDLEDVPAAFDAAPESFIPRASLDMGLIFDRHFEAAGRQWQQTLEPRAYFLYVEAEDQDQLPRFDANPASTGYDVMFRHDRYAGRDRIGDARQVALGVTSRLLEGTSGTERARLSIGQIQYFEDREVNFLLQPGEDPTRSRSPVFLRGRIRLDNEIDISGRYEWEPDAGRSNRGSLSMRYHDEDYRRLVNVSYIYSSPLVERLGEFRSEEESDFSFIWPLPLGAGNLSLIGRWNFSWDRDQTVESYAGLEYNDCCLRTRVVARRYLQGARDVLVDGRIERISLPDTGIFVEFQFKGLATLGQRLDILLDRGIPGYRRREELTGMDP